VLLGILLLAGCGGEDTQEFGEWTRTTDALSLRKDLQISETENYFFGSIRDVDVTSTGRMVVLDGEATHLKVLRPDGTLIDTLGREGQGPGEFQFPNTVEVARDDSVYVFDPAPNRLTVFTPPPSLSLARSVTTQREQGPRGTDAWGALGTVRVLGDTLAVRFRPYYAREEGYRYPAPATWRLMSETGVLGDTLLHERRKHISISFEGQGVGIEALPFDRSTQIAVGPDDRFYHGWTDSLQVRATALDGTTEVIAHVPTESVPATEADRDSALAPIERADIRQQFADAFPQTKPAFTDLVVGDDGRLWVERPAKSASSDTVPWWILEPETQTIHQVRLPREVELEAVQDRKAYGKTTTEKGAPALVRYRVQPRS
jgi:hypothetical protein